MIRSHNEGMKRLRKLLDESTKDRRHRRVLLNIHITTLTWLIEFSGFFFVVLGGFFLGHENDTVTFILQTLSLIFFFIIQPCAIWINDSTLKGTILESEWYSSFLDYFDCQAAPTEDQNEENENEDRDEAINNDEHPRDVENIELNDLSGDGNGQIDIDH